MADQLVQVPEVVLNSGHKMPMLGMGTVIVPFLPIDELTAVLVDAMEGGYRHFDTATMYYTEWGVGRAVAVAIERRIIKSRDEVFITTKLWCTDAFPQRILPALKASLERLGLDYVDLYLVHWPISMKSESETYWPINGEEVVPFDMKGVWEAMEECCKLGMAKSIGVSNFSCTKLSQLLQIATIPPAVNQVEMNVAWQQNKMIEFCKEKGIQVSAWSPLGSNGANWDTPILKEIAVAKQKTIAQVALRWIIEQGACVIVKSISKDRMKQNLQLFDWKLSDEEKIKIQSIPQEKGNKAEFFTHPNGHFKSLDELWDGEI